MKKANGCKLAGKPIEISFAKPVDGQMNEQGIKQDRLHTSIGGELEQYHRLIALARSCFDGLEKNVSSSCYGEEYYVADCLFYGSEDQKRTLICSQKLHGMKQISKREEISSGKSESRNSGQNHERSEDGQRNKNIKSIKRKADSSLNHGGKRFNVTSAADQWGTEPIPQQPLKEIFDNMECLQNGNDEQWVLDLTKACLTKINTDRFHCLKSRRNETFY